MACELVTMEADSACLSHCLSYKELLAALVWVTAEINYEGGRSQTDLSTPDALDPVVACYDCVDNQKLLAILVQSGINLGVSSGAFATAPTIDEIKAGGHPFTAWNEHKLYAALVYLLCLLSDIVQPE